MFAGCVSVRLGTCQAIPLLQSVGGHQVDDLQPTGLPNVDVCGGGGVRDFEDKKKKKLVQDIIHRSFR